VSRSLINFRGPLLEALVYKGHEVTACAPNAPFDVRSALADIGVEYCHLSIDRAGMNPFKDGRTAHAMFCLFRSRRPDSVLTYTAKPIIWGSIAARSAGITSFFAIIEGLGYAYISEGSFKQRFIQSLVSFLYRNALAHTKGVFFLNPDDMNEFRRKGILHPQTNAVLLNGIGVDLKHYSPSPFPNAPVFLLLARLLEDKGIRIYRDAARALRKKHPGARFMLAGGHDENPGAIDKEEILKWQMEGDIEYLGELEDVRPILAQCLVYVLPTSYREGVPRTILEAMSMGRPIITTDTPGCRETVQEGVNGFLVPIKNATMLAVVMERFIAEPDLAKRMGRESRRIAEEKYDVHEVNRVILETMGL
jgi:glycosyltransferase involved in cell wall biosynthesis